MYRNQDLENKVNAIQEEFNALLKGRDRYTFVPGDEGLGMDEFYKVMGEYYDSNMKKHESPTRRLRQ